MAKATRPRDPQGHVIPVQNAQRSATPWREPEPADAPLPDWLLKELQRAGVGAATIKGLDEETARDLVAEIRSDALE